MRNLSAVVRPLVACVACGTLLGGPASPGARASEQPNGTWVGSVCPSESEEGEGCDLGPVVSVSVMATPGQPGDLLQFRWRATDGAVFDRNASSTTWRLPAGPGLHFVYVLVSNGKGAYTEARAVVNTDTIGTPLRQRPTGRQYLAPPSEPVTTGTYQSFSAVPDTTFAIVSTDPNVSYQSPVVRSDLRDRFAISGIPPTAWKRLALVVDGVSSPLSYDNNNQDDGFSGGTSGEYYPDQRPLGASFAVEGFIAATPAVPSGVPGLGARGLLALSDGYSPCGTINEFFGIQVTPSVSGVVGGAPTGPVRADFGTGGGSSATYESGQNLLILDNLSSAPSLDDLATVTARCEGATQSLTFPFYNNLGGGYYGVTNFNVTFADSSKPKIHAISVTLDGQIVGQEPPQPPSTFPSEGLPSREAFFSELGVDSRLSACRYYEAIGIGDCDTSTQTLKNAINFEDWKRATGMAPYARAGRHEVTAAFVNRMDLNLARNHHAISYGPQNTAAYVCNGLGPSFDAVDGDDDVTNSVSNAVAGLNRIACVAMDYISTPGVNGGKPFTRFIIFGPDGRVLPSINLDGRAEKFVPGVCVACHGGSNYAGHFADNGTGLPDLGSHFLPYDAGNFLFSSLPGYRGRDQEAAIKKLNLIVLNGAGPTTAEVNLIRGWYGTDLSKPTLDRSYTPSDWANQEAASNGVVHQVYHQVVAPMCRTCHTAMPERFNLDDFFDLQYNPDYPIDSQLLHSHVLGEHYQPMPNSLVTYNRFYSTVGTSNDLLKLWNSFRCYVRTGTGC